MNWKFFEKYHAKKLRTYASDVSPDDIWEAIEQDLSPKRKNRGFLFVLSFGLLIGLVGAFYFSQEINSSKSKVSAASIPPTEIDEPEQLSNSEPELLLQKRSTHSASYPITEVKQTGFTLEEHDEAKDIKKHFQKGEEKQTVRTVLSSIETSVYKKIENPTTPCDESIFDFDTKQTNEKISLNKEEATENRASKVNADLFEKGSIKDKSGLRLLPIDLLVLQSMSPFKSSYEIPVEETSTVQKTSLKKLKKLTFSLGVEGNLSYASKRFQAGQESSDYIDFLDQIETPLESFGGGLTVSMHYGSNLYVRTGINYDRSNQRIDVDETIHFNQTIDNAIIELYTNKEDEIIPIQGMGQSQVTAAYTLRHFNAHHFISIPMSIGYTFNTKAFRISPEIGFSYIVSHHAAGIAYSSNDLNSVINLDEETWYDAKGLFQYHTGLNLGIDLGDRLSLELNPFFNFMQRRMNAENNPIDQSYDALGLRIRTNYKF